MVPSKGLPTGGTIVSVMGSGYTAGEVQCRFGDVAVSGRAAVRVSSTMVTCIAPGAAAGEQRGPVALEVSANGGADFTSDGKMFMYEMGATVEGLLPSWGLSMTGGQVVTVAGRHFEKSQDLSCRFGLAGTSRGQYVTSTVVACMAPKHGPGSVTVTVTNSAEHHRQQSQPLILWWSSRQCTCWSSAASKQEHEETPLLLWSQAVKTGDAA
jgi:hypothetical protein